jgi:hypothetical protein
VWDEVRDEVELELAELADLLRSFSGLLAEAQR